MRNAVIALTAMSVLVGCAASRAQLTDAPRPFLSADCHAYAIAADAASDAAEDAADAAEDSNSASTADIAAAARAAYEAERAAAVAARISDIEPLDYPAVRDALALALARSETAWRAAQDVFERPPADSKLAASYARALDKARAAWNKAELASRTAR